MSEQELRFVKIVQESRQDARVPVSIRADQLRREMDKICVEKKKIEQALAEIEHWKRDQLAVIYSKRYPKSTACEKTNAVEAEVIARRKPLLSQLYPIEERLNQIRERLKDANRSEHHARESEQIVLLMEIRDLLREICERMAVT